MRLKELKEQEELINKTLNIIKEIMNLLGKEQS